MLSHYTINNASMADILIRNLDDHTLELLKRKAMANNRSMNSEIKSLLEEYAGATTREEAISMINDASVAYEAGSKKAPDLLRLIREERDR